MKTYDKNRWLRPATVDPRAHGVVMAFAAARLEGHELDPRRPSLLTRLSDGENWLAEVRPKLRSSPQGWTLAPRHWMLSPGIPVKLRYCGETQLSANLFPSGELALTRWQRDDARNEEALRVMTALLDGLAENPRKALVWSRSFCAICGRGLTDPVSMEAGIGPECRGPAESFLRAAEAAMEKPE